jgi:hypothetical protein
LEIGRAAILLRQDAERDSGGSPPAWRSTQQAWQLAIAELFECVTPQHHARALDATRQALKSLSPPAHFEPSSGAMWRLHMRALLHATELSLLDDTLPLQPRAAS